MSHVALMERTMQHTVPADSAGANMTIPTIDSAYGPIRPVAFAITGSAADLAFTVGGGDEIAVTTREFAANAQPKFSLGAEDNIFLEADAGATTINIRWFWNNKVPDGKTLQLAMRQDMPTQTAVFAGIDDTEDTVTIPANAVAFVIVDVLDGVGAEGITYRVDDGTANGIGVDVLEGEADWQHPYVIHLYEGDRLRWVRQATNNATVTGYWILHP